MRGAGLWIIGHSGGMQDVEVVDHVSWHSTLDNFSFRLKSITANIDFNSRLLLIYRVKPLDVLA